MHNLPLQESENTSGKRERAGDFRTKIHRVSRAGKSAHSTVALMAHCVRATMDQCTQTPFPGSDLLAPNPFVTSPIKPKNTPGVGDKRALPSV